METGSLPRRRACLHRALGEPHRLAIVDALRLTDLTAGELSERLSLPGNLLAFHLGALEEVGLVERRRSTGDRRRRYVRLRHGVLDELGRISPTDAAPSPAERVAFVCSHNAARSQLAAALWLGRTGRPAQSAGSAPARAVHPLAIAVAGSRGVDLTGVAPRGLDSLAEPDLLITVCDRALEGGTPFAGVPRLHWSIDDPVADGRPAAFARAYDEVAERIEVLAEQVVA